MSEKYNVSNQHWAQYLTKILNCYPRPNLMWSLVKGINHPDLFFLNSSHFRETTTFTKTAPTVFCPHQRDNIVTIKQGMEPECFRLTQWLKIIPHMIRSYYRCCCIHEPVIFSHHVHLKLWHRFHALSKVCSDRDDIAPFKLKLTWRLIS